MKESLLLVGRVLSAQGIAGNVIVKSFTSPPLNLINMQLVDSKEQKFVLKLIRQNSQGNFICRVKEVNNRTMAQQLKGQQLFCYKSDLPLLTDDEFYIEDLKGLAVVDPNLAPIGKIINIFNFGAGDVIEIKFISDKKVELFPFNKQFFPLINKEYIILHRD